ncbi:hypothetical protein H6F90_22505 [Trichocoleus sp. FACHB-591]|uniref:hypothetical protein n=1 Tax=Trichocoleus sp. FACHB-591 TaxID=2692872 RepID=UPI0016880462|nr:hypothetical protein [Trichocoleus sp. FACHB-591]MBD2097849.1 hypothetical protein [Trichocoleus sp. FACHB-591]
MGATLRGLPMGARSRGDELVTGAVLKAVIGLRDIAPSFSSLLKSRTLGGTCPQTPAEGRLRPPDLLQKGKALF